jgi:2-keto-4-pentenoate hydratase/2-oxohepta-3-ene-1,7-dioic acid hydratase in catechol pathway
MIQMTSYRLASYQGSQGPRAGLVVAGLIYDLATISGRENFQTVLGVLADWRSSQPLLETVAGRCRDAKGLPVVQVRLLAPVLYPPAIYCAGYNYADHNANMERRLGIPPGPDLRATGFRPFHFLKASRCCVGQDSTVRAPSKELDWEGELVAIIGIEARNVSASSALEHVAGYMAGNDLSARDLGFRPQLPPTSIFYHSFIDHKSFEGAAPVGPWIVPASEVPDPSNLRIRTEVNGAIKQDGNSSGMIFSVQEQIAYLSTVTPLYPGDLIMTGTPAGAGAETGEFLRPGDRVTVSIEGLGSLTTCIA